MVIVSDGITWCFRRFQGCLVGTFVPAFEFVGLAACLVRIWQGFGTGVLEVIARNTCLLSLRETCWRCDFSARGINEVFGDFFVGDN